MVGHSQKVVEASGQVDAARAPQLDQDSRYTDVHSKGHLLKERLDSELWTGFLSGFSSRGGKHDDCRIKRGHVL